MSTTAAPAPIPTLPPASLEAWARAQGLSTAPAPPSVRAGEPCPE